MTTRNLSEVCDRRVNRGKCGSGGEMGCQPCKGAVGCEPVRVTVDTVKEWSSSRVLAREWSVAVTEQRDETERWVDGRIASTLAKAD